MGTFSCLTRASKLIMGMGCMVRPEQFRTVSEMIGGLPGVLRGRISQVMQCEMWDESSSCSLAAVACN